MLLLRLVETVLSHPSLGMGSAYSGIVVLSRRNIRIQVVELWRVLKEDVDETSSFDDKGEFQCIELEVGESTTICHLYVSPQVNGP